MKTDTSKGENVGLLHVLTCSSLHASDFPNRVRQGVLRTFAAITASYILLNILLCDIDITFCNMHSLFGY